MNFTFLIPHYKKPEQLVKCQEHIKAAIAYLEVYNLDVQVNVRVHDNNKDNLGFTKAVNILLKDSYESADEFSVVLNQDCYIEKDFIIKAIDFMENHPDCFIAGVKQISDKDDDFIIHGGCTMAFPEGRHIVGQKSKGSCSKDKQMPWINGACMIVNMSHLLDVGLMDENFFLLGSDSDWCYTARMKGKEVWYASDIEVVHEGGVSTKKDTKAVEDIKMLDMTYWRDKWVRGELFKELHLEVF